MYAAGLSSALRRGAWRMTTFGCIARFSRSAAAPLAFDRGSVREVIDHRVTGWIVRAVLLEALNRRRGKGQQKVTVEHVTVNAGGQAVVGSVTTQGRGAGRN